jgi:ABC-type branched-subunit amino acid transport system ATPase component/branched-subunit amino acid ABC-type transport system permease component
VSDLLPFLIIGLVTGSIYGLAGIGLVLTYKTSGIFNFAHGALATIAAYTFYELWVTPLGLPWGVALVVTLVVLSAVLGLSLERLGERLSQVSLALRVVATVGLILVVEATYFLIYGPTAQLFPEYLPTQTFRLGGVNVGYDQAIIFGVSAALMGALYLLFRTTQIGRQMRAVVDDSELVDLTGVSATSVRRWAWVAGCFLVSLSGILLAPSVDLDPVVLTLLIVQAFGAAAIGGFSSLPLTWVGGLAIGVAASVATKYVGSSTILAGLPPSIPFLVLFVVILFRRRERAYQAFNMAVDSPSAERWRMPIRVQGVGGVAVLVLLALVPTFDTLHLLAWTTGLTTVVLLLSLGLLVRLSGQVSLCQISFAAVGAVAFSHIDRAGVPWVLALVIAGLVAVPLGALLAIPAIRLSGLYLALATFGFGLLLQDMFYQSNLMFGPSNVGIPVPRPSFASGNEAFYYVVLAVTVVIAGVVVAVSFTRLGRLLHGMAESESAVAVCGTNVTLVKIVVFCLSAFIAAIAGALSGMSLGTVTGTNFDPTLSLTYIALIVISVGGAPWYALPTGIGVALAPVYITSSSVNYYLELFFGLSAISVACGMNTSMPESWRAWFSRVGGARSTGKGALKPSAAPREPDDIGDVRPHTLEVKDLTVRFGGLVAVDGLSFSNRTGVITGLIGPNGAGKTTTFNACSGLVPITSGRVLFDDADITSLAMPSRAKRGLGRTFQTVDLLDSYSAADNVRLAAESALTTGTMRVMVGRRSDSEEITQRTDDALEACGLSAIADVAASRLTNHQRRLLGVARCLAAGFGIVMLDEPSAGLDSRETAEFGNLLSSLVRERGIGVVLVEHDMALVMSVCDEIYVLDFGKEIMHGTPAQVQRDPAVRAAYLGADPIDAAAEERVG